MSKEKLRLDPKTGEFVSVMTEDGSEIPDPTPMAPPVGFFRQVPLHERIRAMVQHEFNRAKGAGEYESPDEADDFVVGDEDDARYGERFAVMPGHEHDWEDNYEPPKDFKDMKERLVAAGWTPPEKLSEKAGSAGTEEPDREKQSVKVPAMDASGKKDADPPRGGSGLQSR